MRPAFRIHGILGVVRDRGVSQGVSSLKLPGGISTSRWLSRGLSRSGGLGTELERELNAGSVLSGHGVLDLRDATLDLEALTDELDPRWSQGLPRLQSAMSDLNSVLPALGVKGEPGVLVLDCGAAPDPRRIRKIWSWCRAQKLGLVVRGEFNAEGIEGLSVVGPDEGVLALARAVRDSTDAA